MRCHSLLMMAHAVSTRTSSASMAMTLTWGYSLLMMNGFTEFLLPKSINWRMDMVSGQMNSLSWIGMWFGWVHPPCVDLQKLVCLLMPSSSWFILSGLQSLRWEMNHDRNRGCCLLSPDTIGEYGLRVIEIIHVCLCLCIEGIYAFISHGRSCGVRNI